MTATWREVKQRAGLSTAPTATFAVDSYYRLQFEVVAAIPEPDVDGDENWTTYETFTATMRLYRNLDGEIKGYYWLIDGDNAGSQPLVVWPYQIDALIALLQRCKAVDPQNARSAQPANPEGAAQSGSPTQP